MDEVKDPHKIPPNDPLASQPVPASSDLVERVAMALSETDLCFVKNFSPPWWGEADAQPGDTIRLTEAEKKYWRTLARAIIPIIQADERESEIDLGKRIAFEEAARLIERRNPNEGGRQDAAAIRNLASAALKAGE